MTKRINNDNSPSTGLVRLPDCALAEKRRKSGTAGNRKKTSKRRGRIANPGKTTLAVKVSRKLYRAKAGLFRRLGLYGEFEGFPLGLFIDVLV